MRKFPVLSSFIKIGLKTCVITSAFFRTLAPFIFGRKTWCLKLKVETWVESVREPDSEENIWKNEE
jgi:hypothetical protein